MSVGVRCEDAQDRPGAGRLVVARGGILDGQRLLVQNEPGCVPFSSRSLTARLAAERRAQELLEGMLDRRQIAEHRSPSGAFWEFTRVGWFRLGTRYDIRFRPTAHPWTESSLCVITDDLDYVPEDDVVVNLLLALRAYPDHFNFMAVVQATDTTFREFGTTTIPPELEGTRIDRLRQNRSDHWRASRFLDAAFADMDGARLLVRERQVVAALGHAIAAMVVVDVLASTFRDARQQARWRRLHTGGYSLMADLAVGSGRPSLVEDLIAYWFERVRRDMLDGPGVEQSEADIRDRCNVVHRRVVLKHGLPA